MTRSLALNYAAVTTVLTAYFVWLGSLVPPEWIERPARTFMNLLCVTLGVI